MTTNRAIYTVLTGGYESLNEQADVDRTGIDFLCLTDDPTLTSETWDIHVVEPVLASDPIRNQRLLKILGHESLHDYDETLYIDNAVKLTVSPASLLDEWLSDADIDIALSLHSYRNTVLDEFDELIAERYDDPARLYEQLVHYSLDHEQSLERQPYWTAILARRNNARIRQAMRVWADHILRYSRRDQLSARVALDESDAVVRAIELDNYASEWHNWPLDFQRQVRQGKSTSRVSGPLVADLRRLTREVEEAREGERDALTAAATSAEEAEGARSERDEMGELANERLEALQEVWRSTSWKVSAPIRALGKRRR